MNHWFDDLAKGLARGTLSRRSMLQWGLRASLAAAGTALFGRSGLTKLVSAKTEGQRGEGCDVHREGRTRILNLSARSNFGGKPLTYDQTTRKISRKGNIEITRTIKVGSSTLLQIEAIQRPNSTQVNINYGEAFQGIRQATFSSTDGKVLRGEIDGRRIIPFPVGSDPSSVKFADGSTPPQVKVSSETTAALKSIMERAKQVAANCSLRHASLKVGPERTQLLFHHAGSSYPIATPQGDPGHDSSPETSDGCISCEGGCTAAGILCGAGAAVACAATFGFGCAAAIAGCALAEIACWEGCHATGAPCCPVSCGDVACCNKAETCLNPNMSVVSQARCARMGWPAAHQPRWCAQAFVARRVKCAKAESAAHRRRWSVQESVAAQTRFALTTRSAARRIRRVAMSVATNSPSAPTQTKISVAASAAQCAVAPAANQASNA